MIRSLLFVTLAAASVVRSEALAKAQAAQAQPFGSRRSFVGKLVTAGAVVATAASNPGIGG